MEKINLAIVGMGRMGKQIAKKLPKLNNTVLIDVVSTPEILKIAEIINASTATNYNSLGTENVIILALNPSQIEKAISEIDSRIDHQCYLINISSSVDLQNLSEKFKIINVKIIGEAEEIDRGNEPAVVVPNNLNNECFSVVKYVFNKFGYIIKDNIHKYKDLNRLIATETLKVLFNLKDQMASKNIDEKITKIAINNVMAGTCKGYPWPDDDEFIQNILKNLNNK